ncbi:MAG: DNA-binding protein HU [Deltaproteobacteria bacterium ADurb.Bin135]|nr:MAG: DNA-binding protein HU [Deltaproteobacteria bacterium ADurb.Bin135]
MPMTKREIIDLLYEKDGLTKKECASSVDATIDIIKSELGKGNDVKISGFGKWTVKSKNERKGRNPQTGESMKISARKVVTFKSSPVLKDVLND